MKKILLALLLPISCFSQLKLDSTTFKNTSPVKWSTECVRVGNDTYQLILRAKIDSGYLMYPNHTMYGEDALSIRFATSSRYQLIDSTESMSNYSYVNLTPLKKPLLFPHYQHEAIFVQLIRVKTSVNAVLGVIDYTAGKKNHKYRGKETFFIKITP